MAYEQADIFVLSIYYPNKYFRWVILKACNTGLSVISTFEGGIPYMVKDGIRGKIYQVNF